MTARWSRQSPRGSRSGDSKSGAEPSLALDIPLKTKASVAVGSLPRRAFDASLELAAGLDPASFQRRTDAHERGRFITLEGGEGAGKSVQARALAHRLDGLGLDVVLTREPGGSPHAEALRKRILSGEAAGSARRAKRCCSPRRASITSTAPSSRRWPRGEWVVCDRFADSTRAYQGAAGRLDHGFIARLERVALGRPQARPDA